MIYKVVLTRNCIKDLKKVPNHISLNFVEWIQSVEIEGLEKVRQLKSFHDEPLKGKRSGQRSIRLSKSYRAIYEIKEDQKIEIVSVLEVNKHEY